MTPTKPELMIFMDKDHCHGVTHHEILKLPLIRGLLVFKVSFPTYALKQYTPFPLLSLPLKPHSLHYLCQKCIAYIYICIYNIFIICKIIKELCNDFIITRKVFIYTCFQFKTINFLTFINTIIIIFYIFN